MHQRQKEGGKWLQRGAEIVPKQDWPRANENAAAAEKRKLHTRECHRMQRIHGRVIGVLTQKQAARDWTSQKLQSEKEAARDPAKKGCIKGDTERGDRYIRKRCTPEAPPPLLRCWWGDAASYSPLLLRFVQSRRLARLFRTHTQSTLTIHTRRHASDRSGALHRKCTEIESTTG